MLYVHVYNTLVIAIHISSIGFAKGNGSEQTLMSPLLTHSIIC